MELALLLVALHSQIHGNRMRDSPPLAICKPRVVGMAVVGCVIEEGGSGASMQHACHTSNQGHTTEANLVATTIVAIWCFGWGGARWIYGVFQEEGGRELACRVCAPLSLIFPWFLGF